MKFGKQDDFNPDTVVRNYLAITLGKWDIKYNERIRGISGREHNFDAVYISQEGEIVTVMIVTKNSDLERRLEEFKISSEDVKAKRKFLITCGEIDSGTVKK
ncbi:hypothetical protein, partial [Thermoplasma sp.]|uniref:hypothetical protein n=1 Tax=Thermoplasma sp. TaxID=1973142 RepID=UPI00126B1DA6